MVRFLCLLCTSLAGLLLVVGCGGTGLGADGSDASDRDAGYSVSDATIFTFGHDAQPGAGSDAGEAGPLFDFDSDVLTISPASLQTITVPAGSNAPTVTFTALLGGLKVSAGWSVDRGDLGTVAMGPSTTTALVPTGAVGGIVTVTAGFGGKTATAQVLIKITTTQNGINPNSVEEQQQIPTDAGELTSGGGVGGVGGEGLGGSVMDPGTLAALQSPSNNGSAENLVFIYPYDGTVWPRQMLAPLLMWSWSLPDGSTADGGPAADGATPADSGSGDAGAIMANADAVMISLTTTSGSFSWTGTFSRPPLLAAGQPFVRLPIPQDIWAMATNSAGGTTSGGAMDELTVGLTVASGGVGYGPITETWPVAPGGLPGIIYYNSYGTQLAQNMGGAVGGNGMFGGAVLSIHVGDTGPQLVAGTNGGMSACRACHSVAAGGSRLVVQHGDNYGTSSAYDLTPTGSVETVLANGATFPAMYPDGTMALSESGQLLPLPADATPTPITGLSTVVTDLGTPSFSPDGKFIAFNPMAGPGVTTPAQQVMVMGFNVMTSTFSVPTLVVDDTGQPAATRPGWPAFFPDGNSLVFHQQSVAGADGNGSGSLYTRKGAKAQIQWTSASDATHVTALNRLNGLTASGTTYLPKLPQPVVMSCKGDGVQVGNINPDHGDDIDVNYEPTVNPAASGGYVWVVFTSRRMYGSEAFIPPFCSDPRGVDLIQNVTPKKLWVAAVDLGAKPGTDASHPAFYLPGQELLAGNSRAFWVLDPCRVDGQSCQSGDMCCNGFCEPVGDGGALICANSAPNNSCSGLSNKCASPADCCDPTNLCVNGFCAQAGNPPPGPQ